jgi:uncharacterized protein (DUF433 family)
VLRATGPKARSVNLAGEVIVKDPDILGGIPVFRGTRVPFQALLDHLEGGQNLDEFIDDFPTVTREAAISALELAISVLLLDECIPRKLNRVDNAGRGPS